MTFFHYIHKWFNESLTQMDRIHSDRKTEPVNVIQKNTVNPSVSFVQPGKRFSM